MLIFGGSSASTAYLNDTWAYGGKTWTQLKPKNPPSGRRYHTMVHGRTRTVMFGGAKPGGNYFAETWVWDGKDWNQIKTTNAPPSRGGGAMVYDSVRQRVVLFGGFNSGGVLNDTWEFDFKNWIKVPTTNSPSPRHTNMVYDTARKRVVLFGGHGTGNFPHLFNDTWEYDGRDWVKMNPATKPLARVGVGMGYDAARQRTVVFGGRVSSARLNDTWEYDGKTWIEIKGATSPPARRGFDNMVYDSRRRRMVLFGGSGIGSVHLGDTWEYVRSPSLTSSPSTISIATGGAQTFSLDAGPPNQNRLYWIFGSVTGTSPGITLLSATGSVTLPLIPDFWTHSTIALANSAVLTGTRGALDASGKAGAMFNVPKITNQAAIGVKFYHAYLIYDVQSNFYGVSNPVTLTLVK